MSQFLLREATAEDNAAVRTLIMTILNEEYAMGLRLAELPDLVDVHDSYCGNGLGNFWVALKDGRVCGCIGLMYLGRGDFELRRMYVDAQARGHGIAQRLLDTLLDWAADNGVESIYLETNQRWHAAHHIYEKNGFQPVNKNALPPEFPIVRVATGFYRLRLGAAAPPNDASSIHGEHA
jgi:N-acetylglutamate synthase-like GNAT family acetyltransferase